MTQEELLELIDQAAREGWTELDLRLNDLTSLPPEIGQLTALQHLDLSGNDLTALPPEIGQLTALRSLNLGGDVFSPNRLSTLPPQIGQLTALTSLNLSSNQLTALPSEIGQLTTLTSLDLSSNRRMALPPEIGQLTTLRSLNLSSNQLTALPPEIVRLSALTSLDLSINPLTALPPEIVRLSALTSLNLSRNDLTTLPPEIGRLSALTSLNLSRNDLTTLPPEIGQLTALQYLDLSGNDLTTLPPEIGQLTALQFLNLSDNGLTPLPPVSGQLTALELLARSRTFPPEICHLTALPPEIGHLTVLQYLDLSGNALTSIPSEVGQLTALQFLDLRFNQLTTLPSEIGHLTFLQSLDLSSNALTSLPSEVGQLTALQFLDLCFNQLTTLPSEIGQLTALQELFLGGNYLVTLPPEVGQLTSLRVLHAGRVVREKSRRRRISRNGNLLSMPSEIAHLINLKTLNLRYNPDFPLPPEILEKTDDPQAIIRAYLDYLAGQKRPLNEVKLVLVGEGSVGKTSLVNRLLHDIFDPQSGKTQGIAIHRWEVANEREGETLPIRVNVWDFGGQEIMHATHQFFLTKRTLYVLVLDSRLSEAENRLDYWLTLIHSFGGDSPILVVGNKTDLHPLDLDRRGLLAKHPTVQAILDTSCATGDGIGELRDAIAQHIGLLPHVTDPLATTWFDVKAALEALDEEYIPYGRYVELCREKNLDHPDSQRVLLGFLHDLGVVLHFPDPRLETTNILNPEWVTQGVYRILHTRLPFEEQGILTWNMLARILDDEPYQEKRIFILDMMQKFELCYELPDRRDTFLLPDLLPKEEPDTGGWDDAPGNPALRFEVHYSVLPGSILTRLIVRMHRLIHAQTVWRTGVLLACDGNEALVKADLVANRITIAVRGLALGRRELLTRVREHLEAIHVSLAGLQAAEKVPVPGHPEIPPVDYKWLRDLERAGRTEFTPPGLIDPVNVGELLAGVDVRSIPGSGLSGALLSQLRDTLARCGSLESDATLRTLFTDNRLYPWRNRIPDNTPNREVRVNALIDALLEQRTARGESALSVLLYVLAEATDSNDALHHTLTDFAAKITHVALRS